MQEAVGSSPIIRSLPISAPHLHRGGRVCDRPRMSLSEVRVDDSEDGDAVRARAFEISQGPEAGTADENWVRAEHELTVAHEYDTVDRDLERLGMTVSRLPAEAGVVWRLRLPRGEQVEAWEPGNGGLRLSRSS